MPRSTSRRAIALALAAAALALGTRGLGAQGRTPAVELDALRTPTAPAFVILDITPTAVERPTTPRAFATSLLSATGGEAGVIPENYAAEVSPYWLAPRRTLTFDQYFRPSLQQRLRQTFSVSLATTTTSRGDSTTGVGIGFRVAPFVGEPSTRLLATVDTLKMVQNRQLDLDIQMDQAATAADSARINGLLSSLGAQSARLAAKVRDNDERVGLHMQFAGAVAGSYPGGRFDGGTVGRSGLWGTLGMRMEEPGMDVIGLARVLWDDGQEQTLWDLGGRAVMSYQGVAASLEFVARSASDADAPGAGNAMRSGNRVVGLLEYQVNPDLFVSFSFGQDYPRAREDGHPLVAILGGELNFGAKPLLLPTR